MKTNRSARLGTAAIALAAVIGIGALSLRPIVARAAGDDETYSHSFRNAQPTEVLAWMGKSGIQVKVDPALLPDKAMTFAFEGMDKDTLVKTFGQMVGLQPERRGNVYSLMKGLGGDGTAEPLGSEDVDGQSGSFGDRWFQDREMEGQDREVQRMHEKIENGFFFGPDFEFEFGPGEEFMFFQGGHDVGAIVEEVMKTLQEAGVFSGKQLSEKQRAELKARLSDRLSKLHSAPMIANPEQHKQMMEELHRANAERAMAMKEHMKEMELHGMRMFEEQHMKEWMKEHEKAMAELHKHLQGLHKERAKGDMTDQQKMEVEKAMAELHKHLQELQKERAKGGMTDQQKMEMEKAMEAMKRAMSENKVRSQMRDEDIKRMIERQNVELGEKMKVLQLKLENLRKFVDSLTPQQRALADKQGYLTPEDLTPAQRELLGIDGKGDIDMNFNFDGQKVVIKSKPKARTGSA